MRPFPHRLYQQLPLRKKFFRSQKDHSPAAGNDAVRRVLSPSSTLNNGGG